MRAEHTVCRYLWELGKAKHAFASVHDLLFALRVLHTRAADSRWAQAYIARRVLALQRRQPQRREQLLQHQQLLQLGTGGETSDRKQQQAHQPGNSGDGEHEHEHEHGLGDPGDHPLLHSVAESGAETDRDEDDQDDDQQGHERAVPRSAKSARCASAEAGDAAAAQAQAAAAAQAQAAAAAAAAMSTRTQSIVERQIVETLMHPLCKLLHDPYCSHTALPSLPSFPPPPAAKAAAPAAAAAVEDGAASAAAAPVRRQVGGVVVQFTFEMTAAKAARLLREGGAGPYTLAHIKVRPFPFLPSRSRSSLRSCLLRGWCGDRLTPRAYFVL